MIQLNCQRCGNSFSVYESRFKKGEVKYCSMQCYKPKKDRIPKVCKQCNVQFMVSPTEHRRGNGIYCSKTCIGKEIAKTRKNFLPQDPIQRFYSFILDSSNDDICWKWTGGKDWDGYGIFFVNKKSIKAHRYAYQILVGRIPSGKLICHTCDNPSCVNPKHLFIGTFQDNVDDMMKKGRHKARSGSCHHNSKLNEELVKIVKQRLLKGDKITHIAKDLNVSITTIFDIKNGNTWKNVILNE